MPPSSAHGVKRAHLPDARRPRLVGRLLATLLGALSLVFIVVPAQAATTYTQLGFDPLVTGSTVSVWAKVSASARTVVDQYGVCVRNSTGAAFDFPKVRNVTLTVSGVEYYRSGENFPAGTYTAYPCVQVGSSWTAVGAARSFSVGASSTPAVPTTSSATSQIPAAPAGYTRRVGEDFGRAAGLGQFQSVYGTDWAGFGAKTNTLPTTARDNGRYRPDKVLSTRSAMSGASDGNVLDFYLHSETLSDDDVSGPTALSAAPLPMGWNGLTCGRFSIRYRADNTDGYKHAHLLWPSTANWNDGEVDFVENEEIGTTPFWAVHIPGTFGTSYSGRLVRDASGGQEHGKVPAANENDWHVATIDLKPGSVKFEWDGKVVGQATGVGENGRTYPNNGVPTVPMVFVLQTETEAWDYANPSPSAAGHQQIDWVTVDAC